MTRVKVYNAQLFNDVTHLDPETERILNQRAQTTAANKRNRSKSVNSEEEKKTLRYEQYWTLQERRLAEADRRVKEHLAKAAQRKEAAFTSLVEKMNREDEWSVEVDRMLELTGLMKRQKVEEMYLKWHEKVFDNIQTHISSELNGLDQDALSKKKRDVFQSFLDATNSKGALFLDTVMEGDYDPLALKPYDIKARTGKIEDPTLRPVTKHKEEMSMIDPNFAYHTGGRETLSVLMWGSGKIESTPHGHFAKHLNKADRGYNADKTDFHDTLSAINMDHYNVARGSEAVDKEFPRGRRTIQTLKTLAKAANISDTEIKAAGKVTDGGPAIASARGPVKLPSRPRPVAPSPIC